ncbi:8837_t:CDS:2, partial [Funneliformis mosseae]
NIKGLIENLSFELDDKTFVTSITPERDPSDELKTDITLDNSKNKNSEQNLNQQ